MSLNNLCVIFKSVGIRIIFWVGLDNGVCKNIVSDIANVYVYKYGLHWFYFDDLIHIIISLPKYGHKKGQTLVIN